MLAHNVVHDIHSKDIDRGGWKEVIKPTSQQPKFDDLAIFVSCMWVKMSEDKT